MQRSAVIQNTSKTLAEADAKAADTIRDEAFASREWKQMMVPDAVVEINRNAGRRATV